ncbi:MAG: hypothetical protein P0S96_03905 [Simkaniaceae bacterium]|nr:hypothetical protein [Candidatus Sacchlamyda saccharinae]
MKFKELLAVSLVTLAVPFATAQAGDAPQKEIEISKVNGASWKEFHSVVGKCTLKFPSAPEHISEKMSVPEEGYDLKYDAYIASQDKKNVYMLLIAEYPEFVDQSLAQASLEGFLNGILANNPGNQLLFADMLLVDGKPALDFFIRTGGVYFKGRAIMVKNQLFLMAMECEVQSYDEGGYNYFVESFKFN